MAKRNYLPVGYTPEGLEPFYQWLVSRIASEPWKNRIDLTYMTCLLMGGGNIPVRAHQSRAVVKAHRVFAWHTLQCLEHLGLIEILRERDPERKVGEGGNVWRLKPSLGATA